MAASATPTTEEPRAAGEERILVNCVPWSTYVQMRDALDDCDSKLRLTYCEGALEIMSPSDDHELSKKLLARLVEAYIDVMGLDVDGHGSTTFRKEAAERGLEPDECYFGPGDAEVPDLAIEVVFSRPKLDKLSVYRGLGVREVWIYRNAQLHVHVLQPSGYEERARSVLFPELDLAHLVSFVRPGERQSRLVREVRASLVRT
jgi:Uma2 family endonuclease